MIIKKNYIMIIKNVKRRKISDKIADKVKKEKEQVSDALNFIF